MFTLQNTDSSLLTTDTAMTTVMYPVMELFYTLQGEGCFTGHAAIFIRLAGCNVGCHWCDVKESWDADKYLAYSIPDILLQVQQFPAKMVVITGGEPLLYHLNPLCLALQNLGYKTHLETSGSQRLSGEWDWICLSPKKFKPPTASVIAQANELKVVIYNKHDFDWAELYAEQVNKNCNLYLQPEWSKAAAITPQIVQYIHQNP